MVAVINVAAVVLSLCRFAAALNKSKQSYVWLTSYVVRYIKFGHAFESHFRLLTI